MIKISHLLFTDSYVFVTMIARGDIHANSINSFTASCFGRGGKGKNKTGGSCRDQKLHVRRCQND